MQRVAEIYCDLQTVRNRFFVQDLGYFVPLSVPPLFQETDGDIKRPLRLFRIQVIPVLHYYNFVYFQAMCFSEYILVYFVVLLFLCVFVFFLFA